MTARRFAVVAALAATTAAVVAAPGSASAHSLASSSVTIELTTDDMTGEVSLAVASLDQAFDDDQRSDVLTDEAYAAQVIDYLDEHLTVTGRDGSVWAEHYENFQRRTVEGIETIDVELSVDVTGDPSEFTIGYDAIIEAVPAHAAVLVVVDATNRASTPGVFTGDDTTITIGEGASPVGVADMIGHGFHHVLDGADHLLFLLTLLLPAPLIAADRRWRHGSGLVRSMRSVAHVVTAFTVGHSLTLAATTLGWITVPSALVEVLIAISVAVSAAHAIRPLARRGEPMIAAAFGLVHGMAFAGILTDLGLDGTTSLVTLFAFNIGIELAQLVAIACVFPSLAFIAERRSYTTVRLVGASSALVAAGGWIVERTGLATNPFTPVEEALVAHPWSVVVCVAALAVAVRLFDRRSVGATCDGVRGDHGGGRPVHPVTLRAGTHLPSAP